jgi:subtilisin family serine protease
MDPLDQLGLRPLMHVATGRPEVTVGLVDGPIRRDHPDLADTVIRHATTRRPCTCARTDSFACIHGTFVAGIFAGRRGGAAPGICPGCTLVLAPLFGADEALAGTTPAELAAAIVDCVQAGAHVVNLSLGTGAPSARGEKELVDALDLAQRAGVIVVAASGNQGRVGGSALTRHPGVIPVVACDRQGRVMGLSNVSLMTGRRGLSAPGEQVVSLGVDGAPYTMDGTSVAAALVSASIALLWSTAPRAGAAEIVQAVLRVGAARRRSIVPPLFDAGAAYGFLHGRPLQAASHG